MREIPQAPNWSGCETLQLYTQPKLSLGTLCTLARGDGRDLSRKILLETSDVTENADSIG